jgi:hypothetical protein
MALESLIAEYANETRTTRRLIERIPANLKMRGKVLVERPKAEAFRDFTVSHIIHHRGQLSVYLRLLDVPVPGAYGPTADER